MNKIESELCGMVEVFAQQAIWNIRGAARMKGCSGDEEERAVDMLVAYLSDWRYPLTPDGDRDWECKIERGIK